MSVIKIPDKRPVLSFEVFPPKTDVGMHDLCGADGVLERLYSLNPGYISCTYDAGGTNVGKNLEVLDKIVRDGKTVGLTQFTCAGNTCEGIKRQLQTYLDHGIDHMLALRGEQPAGWNSNGFLQSAGELVSFIRREFDSRFTIAVAGTPESDIAGRSFQDEIEDLKRKRDSGADRILTRLCWDMDQFRRWLDAVRAADVWLDVDVGVMPVVDLAATISMTLSRRSGAMPRELSELISQNWIYPNPFVKDPFDADAERKKASFKAAGMDYTLRQIDAYRACGVNGIHLHTHNRFEDVAQIAADAGLVN